MNKTEKTRRGVLPGLLNRETAVITLIIAGTSFIVTEPYRTARPERPVSEIIKTKSFRLLDKEIRAWQDPFEVKSQAENRDETDQCSANDDCQVKSWTGAGRALDRKKNINESLGTETKKKAYSLQKEISGCVRLGFSKCVVIPVLVNGGGYADARENRLRDRYALLAALKLNGFKPISNQRMGLWESKASNGLTFKIPFEVYEIPSMSQKTEKKRSRYKAGDRLFVLWIDENALEKANSVGHIADIITDSMKSPLAEMGEGRYSGEELPFYNEVSHCFRKEEASALSRCRVVVLGPSNSDTFIQMHESITEANDHGFAEAGFIIEARDHVNVRSDAVVMTATEKTKISAGNAVSIVDSKMSESGILWARVVGKSVDNDSEINGWVRGDFIKYNPRDGGLEDLSLHDGFMRSYSNSDNVRISMVDDFYGILREELKKDQVIKDVPFDEILLKKLVNEEILLPTLEQSIKNHSSQCSEFGSRVLEFGKRALPDKLMQVGSIATSGVEKWRLRSISVNAVLRFLRSESMYCAPEYINSAMIASKELPPEVETLDILIKSMALPKDRMSASAKILTVSRSVLDASSFNRMLNIRRLRDYRFLRELLLEKLEFYSHRSTADIEGVLRAFRKDGSSHRRSKIQATILADSELIDLIISDVCGKKRECKGKEIVVFSEWDTSYSWYFEEQLEKRKERYGFKLKSFYYLRGIDGLKVRGDNDGLDPESIQDKVMLARSTAVKGVAHPVGGSQLDYLRRLTVSLESYSDSGKKETDAVLIVGSDIYDKILILQAVKPVLPGARYYTTDLDARFFHPEEYRWTRNLRVAASYDLELGKNNQGGFPPFRDSYQTAMFATVQIALGDQVLKHEVKQYLQPRLFEIARQRAIDISPSDIGANGVYPENMAFQGLSMTKRYEVIFILTISICMLVLILRSLDYKSTRYVERLRGYLKLYKWHFGVTLTFLSLAGLVISSPRSWGESLLLASGVSSYGSCIFFALVIVVCIHFFTVEVVKAKSNVFKIEDTVSEFYSLNLKCTNANSQDGGVSRDCKNERKGGSVRIQLLWESLRFSLEKTVKWNRWFLHGLVLFLAVILCFGLPRVPAAGLAKVLTGSLGFISLSVIYFSVLYCLWFARRVSVFVKELVSTETSWSNGSVGVVVSPGKRELADIFIVRRITEIASNLLILPFLATILHLLAKNSFFDDWSISVGITILYIILFLSLGWYTVFLSRLAETAREDCLSRLKRLLNLQRKPELKLELDSAVKLITNEKLGAFAPIREQTLVKLMVIPLGGAAALAVIEYFANFGQFY